MVHILSPLDSTDLNCLPETSPRVSGDHCGLSERRGVWMEGAMDGRVR